MQKQRPTQSVGRSMWQQGSVACSSELYVERSAYGISGKGKLQSGRVCNVNICRSKSGRLSDIQNVRPPEVEAVRSLTGPMTLSLFSTDLRQWLNTEVMPCRQGHRLCYTTNDHMAVMPMMSQVGALMQISPEYAAASNPRNGSQTEHECPTVLRKWHFNQVWAMEIRQEITVAVLGCHASGPP